MSAAHKITARGYPVTVRAYITGRGGFQTGSNRLEKYPNALRIKWPGVSGKPTVLANTENARVHLFARRGDPVSPSPLGGEGRGEGYKDIPGFCKSATLDDIRKHLPAPHASRQAGGHVLTPGRYVGAEAAEDDLPAPRPGVYFVYAIACDDGSHYIGHTDNLPRRWREHVSGQGADWTKKNKPRYIAHYEEFSSRAEAVAREQELKTTAGRRWLKEAIAEGRARQAGGEPFEEKMQRLTAMLREQQKEAAKLDAAIVANLDDLGFHG